MTRTCVKCGNKVFTGDYCYYHRGLAYKDRGWAKKKPQKAIRKVSEKQKKVNVAKSSIKSRLIAKNGKVCFFCEEKANDLVHIIRQSADLELRDAEDNCILACVECHDIFDNKDFRKLNNIDKVLKKMKKLDENYYNRFISRYE